jgi:PncC family amidohydrolase
MTRQEVIDKLKTSFKTLGTVESLTGGLVSSTFTSYSGVSKFFKGSIVSYSSLVKRDVLGISQETIDKYGVVSKEVAHDMAEKGSKILDVDLCLSFTGNAGPDVMENKKVGEVYVGFTHDNKTDVYPLMLKGERNEIRESLVSFSFELLEKYFGDISK